MWLIYKMYVFAEAVLWCRDTETIMIDINLLSQVETVCLFTAAICLLTHQGKAKICLAEHNSWQESCLQYDFCIPPDLNLHVRSRCAIVLLTLNFRFSDNGEIDWAAAPEHSANHLNAINFLPVTVLTVMWRKQF